jgi:soluble lytic murein transglycosylase-like protein
MELALAIGACALVAGAAGLALPRTPGSTASASDQLPVGPAPQPPPPADARALLDAAADRHALPRTLVEAIAYWESGWDQSRVSGTGAVGLMQVQPDVAADLAPRLVGHPVDLQDAAANADLGAAILRAYIDDQGGDVENGLAAYYEGPAELAANGYSYDTADYVSGVTALWGMLDRGEPLPPPPP